LVGVVGCIASACGEAVVDVDALETSASSDDTSSSVDTTGDPSADESSTSSTSATLDESDSSTDASSDTGTPTTCGNGTVEVGEECDDGNTSNADACNDACAIPFEVAWDVRVDGEAQGLDAYTAVAVDDDGTMYAAGSTTTATGRSIVVAQWMSDGTAGWSFVWDADGSSFASASAIALHPDGDLVVAGRRESEDDDADAVVFQLSTDAPAISWSDTVDGPGSGPSEAQMDDLPVGVAVDAAGGIVVVGRIGTDAGSDAWMRRYEDGVEAWSAMVDGGAGGDDEAVDVVVEGDGALVIAIDVATPDARETRLERRTADGTVTDAVSVGQFWTPEEIATTPDGGFALVGWDAAPQIDIVATKFDADFVEVWRTVIDGPALAEDWGESVAVDADGDVYVAGQWNSVGRGRNAVIRKLSGTDGSSLWSDDIDGGEMQDDAGWGVATTSDGAVLVGMQLVTGHDYDAWVRRYVDVGL
jgi:cysteine-rich repeat protein